MSKRGRRASEHMHVTQSRRRWWLAVAALAALAILAAILMTRPAPPAQMDDAHDPVLGSAAAPLTIYYFADFQCPWCREFELRQLDALRATSIDPGDARLVFKDLPILGEDSWTAAQASQSVWTTTPDLYWTWHRAVFEAQGEERSGWANASGLAAVSAQVEGVDVDAMLAAIGDGRYLEETQTDRAQGNDAGVRGTPTLVIGGRVVNALDAAAVRAAIEGARTR